MKLTKKDKDKADNYHYLSYEYSRSGSAVGTAKQLKDGRGTVCSKNQMKRFAITEVHVIRPESDGRNNTWKDRMMEAAGTFAHELGHALGMPHDKEYNEEAGFEDTGKCLCPERDDDKK